MHENEKRVFITKSGELLAAVAVDAHANLACVENVGRCEFSVRCIWKIMPRDLLENVAGRILEEHGMSVPR